MAGADHIKICSSGGVASLTDKLESSQFTIPEIRAICDTVKAMVRSSRPRPPLRPSLRPRPVLRIVPSYQFSIFPPTSYPPARFCSCALNAPRHCLLRLSGFLSQPHNDPSLQKSLIYIRAVPSSLPIASPVKVLVMPWRLVSVESSMGT